MERIFLITGEHPTESVAARFTTRLETELTCRNYRVRSGGIPLLDTFFGKLIKKPQEVKMAEFIADTAHDRELPTVVQRIKNRWEKQGYIVYRVHNSPVELLPEPRVQNGAIELPAVYKETKNRRLLVAAKRIEEDIGLYRLPEFERRNWETAIKYYLRMVPHGPSSNDAGLTGNDMVNRVADLIESDLMKQKASRA